jgi:hypothetical protein
VGGKLDEALALTEEEGFVILHQVQPSLRYFTHHMLATR